MTSTQKIIKYCALAFAFFLIFNIFSGIIFGITIIGEIFDSSEVEDLKNVDIYNQNANSIVMELKATNLKIKVGNTLRAETNNKYINVKQDNNKLYITERSHNLSNYKNNDLIVYVPQNVNFDVISLTTGAGNIEVDSLNSDEIIMKLGAGNVSIKELNVYDEAKIEGGVGKLLINGGRINDLNLSLGVGETIINSNITGDNDIETGIGKLELNLLGDKNNYKIFVEKGMGSIEIDGQEVSNKTTYGTGYNDIDIEGGIGSIEVNFKNRIILE